MTLFYNELIKVEPLKPALGLVFHIKYRYGSERMLAKKIVEILGDGHCKATKINNGFEITIGQMYNAPSLNFATLCKLSELFGTKEINVDNYSVEGCDTCDYGSDYGHTIQITNVTQNATDLEKILNVELNERYKK